MGGINPAILMGACNAPLHLGAARPSRGVMVELRATFTRHWETIGKAVGSGTATRGGNGACCPCRGALQAPIGRRCMQGVSGMLRALAHISGDMSVEGTAGSVWDT
jgi:hypothetical protein